MSRPACIEIDLTALRANFNRIREQVRPAKILVIVKANAYGHGLIQAAQILALADGFGVACLNEAIALRQAGIKQKIVLLEGFFTNDELDILAQYQLDTVIHNHLQLKAFIQHNTLPKKISIWLKLNTGLNRLGFTSQALTTAWQTLKACPWVNTIYLMSHFSCADQLQKSTTLEQMTRFTAATTHLTAERSLANSAAILAWPQTYADWVRPGLILYGVSPFAHSSGGNYGLQPVMTLTSQIIAIQQLHKNDTVGYHGSWIARENNTRIGIVALGYGDGYPHLSGHISVPVLINKQLAYSIGRTSMDMITINLSNHPRATIGDTVVFWGKDLPIEQVSHSMQRSVYELLCGINHSQQWRLEIKTTDEKLT